ncbi:hypothetical protein GH714_030951 [Hevea brasiliensis]|uniref:Uncharacterized protein n=1 Tax=Hevea brasiliensis TaxID=3981 RepID=A0A6A6LCN6_HEVBR|nr:hypothetical protein GH714_030951 [Hevea brasiliensis]
MGQHEPYWQTNTSFSPPPSRWDFSLPSEELPYDHVMVTYFILSQHINSKESRWMNDNHLYNNHCSASGGAGLLLSSPPDLSPGPQWTPPVIQEINADDYETATRRGLEDYVITAKAIPWKMRILSLINCDIDLRAGETSGKPDSGGSTSSFSDSYESEPTFKSCLSSHYNFSGRRSFLSKPIHPLFFPTQAPKEASETPDTGLSEFDAATVQRDAHRWSSASSSIDSSDVSEPFESEILGPGAVCQWEILLKVHYMNPTEYHVATQQEPNEKESFFEGEL